MVESPFVSAVMRVRVLLPALLFIVFAGASQPQAEDNELAWSHWLAEEMDGTAEYRLPDGCRIDILTADEAIEVEWPSKWAEGVGQAVYYGIVTGKQPRLILLMGRNGLVADTQHWYRAMTTCQVCGVRCTIQVVPARPKRGD